MVRSFDLSRWNTQKLKYDLVLMVIMLAGYAAFISTSSAFHGALPPITIALRSTAFMALLLFQLALSIGPLTRLQPRFLPLLYNRRHLGICVFFLATLHGALAIIHYHARGDQLPIPVLLDNFAGEYLQVIQDPSTLAELPFEPFGAAALLLLYIMAATSHDYWQRILGSGSWKLLQMVAYPAYVLILLHVAFGYLQSEAHPANTAIILGMAIVVVLLQVSAYLKGFGRSERFDQGAPDTFVSVFQVTELASGQARSAQIGEHAITFLTHQNRIYALTESCPHQGGPLGEGQIADGCITCPWHGRQFSLTDGACLTSPKDRIDFYPVQVVDGMVQVKPVPVPTEMLAQGVHAPYWSNYTSRSSSPEAGKDFYIGHRNSPTESTLDFLRAVAVTMVVACPIMMAAFAALQPPSGRGNVAPQIAQGLTGVYYSTPVPGLYVPTSPKASLGEGTTVLLSGPGKQGVPEAWHTLNGKKIAVDGRLFYLGETVMLALLDQNMPEVLGEPVPAELRPELETVGTVTVTGELVASKCYLGAMEPGTGKIHRSCAMHSLAGGVTAGLRVRSGGRETVVLLAGEGDASLVLDLTWAARQINVEGVLQRTRGFSAIVVKSVALAELKPEVED